MTTIIERRDVCRIYRDGGGRETPDSCRQKAEVRAVVEKTYNNTWDSGDPESDGMYCRPNKDCEGNALFCCNPDKLPSLFNISKHRIS